jgi:hypothetical protein
MKMIMQFRLFEMQTELTSVEGTLNATAKIFAAGKFVWEKQGQNVWSSQSKLEADGSVTGYIRFVGDKQAKTSAYVGPLMEMDDCFEFDITVPESQIPWFASMVDECTKSDKVLSIYAESDDIVDDEEGGNTKAIKTFERLLIRPFNRVIELSEVGAAA